MSVRERTAAPPRAEPGEDQVEGGARFERAAAEVSALAAAVVQAGGDESRRAAEALKQKVAALPGRWPGAQVQALLQRLLDDPALGEHPDEAGDPLRRTLVGTQQRLGFPWALEVHPDDLAHLALRPARARRGLAVRALTFFSGALALVWNALLLWLMAGALGGGPDPGLVIVAKVFAAVGIAHALAAMVAAAKADQPPRRMGLRWLRRLAWSGLLGPAVALGAAAVVELDKAGPALLVSLLCAGPSMLVAALCGLTVVRLESGQPQRPEPPPLP